MQVEQVDGERRSSDAVDEKVGEAQPRRRRQDEQGAEDDVWGGIKKSTATPYVRDYPPIKKAENASIIPGMRINDRAARLLYVGSLLKRERVVKMHVTS